MSVGVDRMTFRCEQSHLLCSLRTHARAPGHVGPSRRHVNRRRSHNVPLRTNTLALLTPNTRAPAIDVPTDRQNGRTSQCIHFMSRKFHSGVCEKNSRSAYAMSHPRVPPNIILHSHGVMSGSDGTKSAVYFARTETMAVTANVNFWGPGGFLR